MISPYMQKQVLDYLLDKWLNPPDEPDTHPEADEMDLANIERQRQLDQEDWQAEIYRQRVEDQGRGWKGLFPDS